MSIHELARRQAAADNQADPCPPISNALLCKLRSIVNEERRAA